MPHLQLESERHGTLRLDGIATTGKGWEAQAGAAGLGLPVVQNQWLEGAGHGSSWRGKRVLSRDIDLPLYFLGDNREELIAAMDRLSLMVSDEMVLRFVEDDSRSWFAKVRLNGGGDYSYGEDTRGDLDVFTVITLRAGEPFFSRSTPSELVIRSNSGAGLLNGSLSSLQLSASQAYGMVLLDNPGTTEAYAQWEIKGPATKFFARKSDGERFIWRGTLLAGDTLTIDTQTGLCVDQNGDNRYSGFDPAPRLWTIEPGTTEAELSLDGADSTSEIRCLWRPRKWLVI